MIFPQTYGLPVSITLSSMGVMRRVVGKLDADSFRRPCMLIRTRPGAPCAPGSGLAVFTTELDGQLLSPSQRVHLLEGSAQLGELLDVPH